MVKKSEVKIRARIIDMKPDPLRKNRMLISIEFDDGNKKLGPWHQAFSLAPSKILTIDDLIDNLYKSGIERPSDPYQILKKAMKNGETFDIDMTKTFKPEK